MTTLLEINRRLSLLQHIIAADLQPGDPGYFKLVQRFMPIQIPLGVVTDLPPDLNDVGEDNAAMWEPGKESNGFFMVLGASGSGKTECLKKIGYEIVKHAIPVLTLDFHGDVIFSHMHSVLISSGCASVVGVNPLAIPFDFSGQIGPKDQRNAMVSMFTRAIPALGHNQRCILQEAIEAAFRSAGIMDDNICTWSLHAPQMKRVLDILYFWSDDERRKLDRASIRGCISAIKNLFDHPIFQRMQTLSIEQILSSNTRIDLSKVVDDGVRFVVTETLLRMIFNALRQLGPIPVYPADDSERFRIFIIIDEAKILSMGRGDPNGRDRILNVLATEGRKFGIGLILASQVGDHFGDETKANISSRLVLKPMDFNEAKKNAKDVQLAPEKVANLRGFGDGFFLSGANGRAIRVQVQPIKM